MQQHALDSHPQKQKAIDWLLAGQSVRAVAARLHPPVSFNAVQRYKEAVVRPAARAAATISAAIGNGKSLPDNPLSPAVTTAVQSAIQAQPVADLYLSRIAQHRATTDRCVSQAVEDGDHRSVAALISTDLKGLELDARLTGRLDGPGATQNNYYIMAGSVSMTVPAQQQTEQVKVVDVEVASCDRTDV